MKLKIQQIEIEAETMADVAALVALALDTLAKLPQAPTARPALAIPGAPVGDRERELRDAFKARYGKGFSMKGRNGSPLAILEALDGAGWPEVGAVDGEALDGPPASLEDDGEEFV